MGLQLGQLTAQKIREFAFLLKRRWLQLRPINYNNKGNKDRLQITAEVNPARETLSKEAWPIEKHHL